MFGTQTAVKLLTERRERVSFIESLTGGMLCGRIVDVPGASDVLDEAYVTYANESKMRIAGVQEETLRAHGAVSEECAKEMALGALARSGADWAVSTTGIAGPGGGTDEKPVGLVYVAVAHEGKAEAFRFQFRGNREWIRTLSCEHALNCLRLAIEHAEQK